MRSSLPLLHRRALAIALGLLLLLTQQVGLQHLLAHALAGPVAGLAMPDAPMAAAAADIGVDQTAGDGQPADSLCQVCLALATLGLAALPALWRWLVPRLAARAPAEQPAAGSVVGCAAPYLARAPPAPQALT